MATAATAVTSYGKWDFLYASALLEPDRDRLAERITAAETAIYERLAHQIWHSPGILKGLSDLRQSENDSLSYPMGWG
jgi:hypothetical protein